MNTFLAVFNAFPAILASVQAVEAAIPMPKMGQQKLNLVLGAASTAWEIGQVGEQMNESNMLVAVTAMTNLAVAGLNAAGVFGTSQPAPATATPATTAAPVSSN
jgi:hypothetical protein